MAEQRGWRVGIEVGGTFTDLVAIGPAGLRTAKVPSVPSAPDEGLFAALAAAELPLAAIDDLIHGSTVATNAVLERRGARVALLVTQGFRDVILIGRSDRPRIFDLAFQRPAPLVRRRDIFEVPERMGADGVAVRVLDLPALEAPLRRFLEAQAYDAIAVCLINGYANPDHEEAVAALARRLAPAVLVSASSRISREFREYERMSTAALSAFVQPVIDRYLQRVEARLAGDGFRGRFSVMQSNGGRLPAQAMRESAITALFSGPAAGVIGASRQAALSGVPDIITLDMGGTSTDVCVVSGAVPGLSAETKVDGLPLRMPVIDIETIGAGGGSIVWRDEGGMLKVGPASAGADPGPACYRRGGALPTVTDAHVVIGTLRPEAFLGGRMALDAAASRAVFAPIAAAMGMSVEAMALSAVRLATANIVRALRRVSTERGRDPRDFVLMPFGGAGPLHAAAIAQELGMRRVLVPPSAGVMSAYGLLRADFSWFESMTRAQPLDGVDAGAVRAVYDEMAARARERFAHFGLPPPERFSFVVAARLKGQAFEVDVAFDDGMLEHLDPARLRARFAREYARIYTRRIADGEAVELVSYRLGAMLPQPMDEGMHEAPARFALPAQAPVYTGDGCCDARLVSRAELAAGDRVPGPAVIPDATSTVFVPAGWRAQVDEFSNLELVHG